MESKSIATPSFKGYYYVYRLQSIHHHSFGYTGVTSNLHRRIQQHNRRKNPSTAAYAPFDICFAAAFPSKQRALAFEAYLKSGSGHAFAKKRLW
ncbi:MAG: GIY-YIG nuclease family protein [Puniceicoccaceae bacterium]